MSRDLGSERESEMVESAVKQLLGNHGQNLEQLKQMSDELQRDEKSTWTADHQRNFIFISSSFHLQFIFIYVFQVHLSSSSFRLSLLQRPGAEDQEEETGVGTMPQALGELGQCSTSLHGRVPEETAEEKSSAQVRAAGAGTGALLRAAARQKASQSDLIFSNIFESFILSFIFVFRFGRYVGRFRNLDYLEHVPWEGKAW